MKDEPIAIKCRRRFRVISIKEVSRAAEISKLKVRLEGEYTPDHLTIYIEDDSLARELRAGRAVEIDLNFPAE